MLVLQCIELILPWPTHSLKTNYFSFYLLLPLPSSQFLNSEIVLYFFLFTYVQLKKHRFCVKLFLFFLLFPHKLHIVQKNALGLDLMTLYY
jgi:hypothetical protein